MPDKLFKKIYSVATDIRKEMIAIHGDDLSGDCIEASEKIVEALSVRLGIKSNTVEGWCKYDDEYYGSDRPCDPHTWVEVPSLGLYIDVTADQFNYGMYSENEFPEIIVQKDLPHGMQYEEPKWDEFEIEDDSFDSLPDEVKSLLGDISNLRHELDGISGYPYEEELAPAIEKRLFIRECQLCAAMKGVKIDESKLKAIELSDSLFEEIEEAGSLEDYLKNAGFLMSKPSLDSMIESATARNMELVSGSKEIERDSALR